MDVVLALTIEWYDKRLVWGLYDYTQEYAIPIKTIEVSSDQIWTPRIDIANRLHDYSPSTERLLHSTVRFDGNSEKNLQNYHLSPVFRPSETIPIISNAC